MMVDDKGLYDEIMEDPEVQAEIEKIKPEFNLLRQILRCRKEAGLTQTQLAERMGTTQSGLSRIESRLMQGKMPSLHTLQRYADAVGKKLVVTYQFL